MSPSLNKQPGDLFSFNGWHIADYKTKTSQYWVSLIFPQLKQIMMLKLWNNYFTWKKITNCKSSRHVKIRNLETTFWNDTHTNNYRFKCRMHQLSTDTGETFGLPMMRQPAIAETKAFFLSTSSKLICLWTERLVNQTKITSVQLIFFLIAISLTPSNEKVDL